MAPVRRRPAALASAASTCLLLEPALRRAATALSAVLALVVASPASGADPVRSAEAQVAEVREQVERTARELSRGAAALERGQAELAQVQQQLVAARREAEQAGALSEQAREQLRAVVGAAYRSPLRSGMVLALTTSPERFGATVAAQADLARVRGRQQDLLAEAGTQRVRAATAVRAVEQLTEDTSRRTTRLAEQTAALRASAEQGAARLTAASAQLAGVRRAAAVLATCAGGATGGAPNGFLPRTALCPLPGGGALRADAAASFARMSAAHRADRGSDLCVTDSYRSYARQVDVFRRKPRLAAVPGTSRHGLGVALDLGCGIERFGSAGYRWMKANAGRFGWVHPAWAEPGGSMPEPWHWEFTGS